MAATRSLSASMQDLGRQLLGSDDLPDAELVRRFAERRDEAAFAALVHRHGGLVYGVCLRILRHRQDAEDAFQAVFIVLARNAARVQRASAIGNWLYGVACNVARKSKSMRHKRQEKERAAATPRTEPQDDSLHDLRETLDAEVHALPGRYREAIVLCDLQGLTRQQAADELGLSPKTLGTRLDRGRALLGHRLTRRGIALSVAALASASVSPALAAATVSCATGQTPTSLSIALLTHGVTQTMISKSFLYVVATVAGLTLAGVAAHAPSLAARTTNVAGGSTESGREPRAARKVDPLAGIHALLRALHAMAFAEDKKDDKPTAAAGKWEKKDGELTMEFAGKDELKISPHGKDDVILILCSYTLDKDGLAKCKVTGFEGKAEIQDKLKEKVPVGTEFTFKWKVKADAGTLDEVKGEKFELFKSHLEGDFTKKK
jgi:RNA polymerase sigma factor (sigma-70 family)